jgi:PmbA protein
MIDRQKVRAELEQTNLALLEEIKKLEPGQSEVFAGHSTQMKIVYENKDFSISSSHASTTYGLRAITNHRLGFVTTNNLDKNSVKDFAREAQMIASLSPASPHNVLPQDAKGEKYFESFEESLAQTSPKELLAWAQMMIDEARKDSRVSIDRAEITLSAGVASLANSHGVVRTMATTDCGWFLMGMGKTDSEVTSFDYEGDTVATKSSIEEKIRTSMARFRDSAVSSLGAENTESYKGLVLLHPYAVMDLIGGTIMSNINGHSHVDNISPWKGKVGQKVVSEMIEAFEDPLDKSRITGWSPFDREGLLSQKHSIISDGALKFIAHNSFSASRAGAQSTGNATGGSRGLPGVGISNFVIKASQKAKALSDTEMEKLIHKGLVLKRFSGNSDAVSGQFSGVAKNSWLIENGKRGRPVQEVMVAGNIFDVMNQVKAIGSTSHDIMGTALAPYILVDGLSVTAG